jgi:hypothetical protein
MPVPNVDMENALWCFYSFPIGPLWQILGQYLDQPVALSFQILTDSSFTNHPTMLLLLLLLLLFVFLALQPIVVVFSQPSSGL